MNWHLAFLFSEPSSQGRSPSRNALLGSRENVTGERNEVVIWGLAFKYDYFLS